MSMQSVEFSNVELRAVMKFLFLQKKTAKEIHECMMQTLSVKCPSYSTVKKWCANFQRGDFETEDAARSGRPSTVTTPEIVDRVHDLILSDRRIAAKTIAETLKISRERVGFIINEQLDMQKMSAKWVPKCLNADEKRKRVDTSKLVLQHFEQSGDDFLQRLVTVDETWLHHYDPETKQQSMQWRHSGSPRPKKFKTQRSAGKVMATVFWDSKGVLLPDYLPKGQTINAEYYSNLLCRLQEALKEKRRGKLRKGVLFLQDNAPAHKAGKTMNVLKDLGFECIDHPPYSPDLAPSDYFLFPNLKKILKGKHFSNDSEVISAAEQYLSDQTSEFFLEGLKKLQKRCAKCVELRGEYVE